MTSDPRASASPGKHMFLDDIKHYYSKLTAMREELQSVYFGKPETVESLLIALLAGGHILLLGAPGVAKTMLAKVFSELLGCSYKRIQFTPDLLPSDITGVYIPNAVTGEFNLHCGPIFANIVLSDEINRAPAKTQSALLEAMQEGQVTIEGTTHRLDEPFMVIATQNPIDQKGVYELPEAQLDRFLLQVELGYPTFEQEFSILKMHQVTQATLPPRLQVEEIKHLRILTDAIHINDDLLKYIAKITRATRTSEFIALGASPRAGIALVRASKALALIRGRDFVLPEDIRSLVPRVLGHRLTLTIDAEFSNLSSAELLKDIVRGIPYAEN